MKPIHITALMSALIPFLSGCGGGSAEDGPENSGEAGLTKIVLQTDWYAQPEHGGFYQAVAEGYYEEEGLEVEILPGGPNALAAQRIAQGQAQFAIGRSDEVIIGSERGIELVMIGALMQKDPQAIMFHEESGIETLADLDGRSVMAGPGSAFIEILKLKYGIDFSVIPLDYGMSRFLADKQFVQQCFITNEPFYVSREGANVKTILLSESGFNPYRVWYTSKSYLRRNPEIVAAFHRASIRGWQDYLFGDRSRANAMIAERNPKMDTEFMEYVHQSLIENNLVTGDSGSPEDIGRITRERVQEQLDQLYEIDMLSEPKSVDDVFHDITQAEAEPGVTSVPPIPVYDLQGTLLTEIDGDSLKGLRRISASVELETAGKPTAVRGVYLGDLFDSLELPAGWDLILADCSDGYQSNYTREVLAENRPLLILEIEGIPTHQWCKRKGQPQWGPFMVEILEHGNLLDPVNKNPWGLQSFTVARLDDLLETLAGSSADWQASSEGFFIYKGNCASCHAIDSVNIGGSLSTRNAKMLSALARHAEDYFKQILKDPVGTNPAAEKMPAVPHYGEQEIEAVIAFLGNYR